MTEPETSADQSPGGAEAEVVPSPATGDARVDAAIGRLADTHGRPAAEHVEVFEDVHHRLQEALASLDGET